MREVNPQVWFGERELKHVPPHFIRCETPTSDEALLWVDTMLVGRYALSSYTEDTTFFLDFDTYIYFENPSEATMYELRWSGSK